MNGKSGCWIVHGHRGAGKTLVAMEMAREYLKRGRPVVSNMTINLDHLMGARNKCTYIKIPGIPKSQDLFDLGRAYPKEKPDDYDESKNGLCIIDECGAFLNSREWNHPDRKHVFRWITQSRKLGWDLILLIQDFDALDAQMRRSLADEVVSSLCLNRIKVPFLPIRLPAIHMYVGHYKSENGPVTFKKYLRGKDLYKAYHTDELVASGEVVLETGAIIDMAGPSCGLSAWHLLGRYLPPAPTGLLAFAFLLKWFVAWPSLLAPGRRSRPGAEGVTPLKADLARLFPLLLPHIARGVYANDQTKASQAAPVPRQAVSAHSVEAYRLYRYREAQKARNGVQGTASPAVTAQHPNVLPFPRGKND